jgi:hypothetical protein
LIGRLRDKNEYDRETEKILVGRSTDSWYDNVLKRKLKKDEGLIEEQ